MESCKLLSPDLNSAIIASSTTQTAQRLASVSSGALFQNVVVQSNAPFQPIASAIRINVTWLLSLVLSLTDALSVARPYWGFAQHHGARHKSHTYILRGIERSRPSRVIDTMPTFLHLSFFFFITGLIDFLLLVNKTAAFCVLGYFSAFSFACLVFTALPSQYLDHPRRPSGSPPGFARRISLILVLAVLVVVVEIGGLLHGFLSSIWNRAPLHAPEHPPALATWRDTLEAQIRRQQRSPTDGLRQSIDRSATAVQLVDASPLCRTLSALDKDQEIENFVARIPGVFESRAIPCMSSAILSSADVSSGRSTSDPILGSCFHDLLITGPPDTSPLTEESHRNRLRTCLKSLWHCGRAYHRLGNSAPLPHYAHTVFTSPEMTRRIQNEQDPTARAIGRCFTSLIAKKLSCDANARSGAGIRFSDAELTAVSAILGTSSEMMDRLGQPGVIGLANIISLLSGEIDTLLDGKVPMDVEQIIQETVVILGTEALHADENASADLPLDLVAQFQGVRSKVANALAPEWLRVQLRQISERLPTIPSRQGLDDDGGTSWVV
jgi:hypothetical protein